MMFGRRYALQYLRRFQPGTVGHVVQNAVNPFARIFGDFASGNIGAHYENDVPHLMARNATRTNLMRLALRETNWWRQQTGLPGLVGGAMGHRTRYRILAAMMRRLQR